MSVIARTGTGPAPTGKLCRRQIEHQGIEDSCHVITAGNSSQIRLAWRAIPNHGRIYYATRFYDNAEVTIEQMQTSMLPDQYRDLTAPVFTEVQLGDVAAMPAFNPLAG